MKPSEREKGVGKKKKRGAQTTEGRNSWEKSLK